VIVLGIVRDTHDSGVALLVRGVPEFVVEEERLSRRKHTYRFPELALAEVLDRSGVGFENINAITVPWDVRRLRRTAAMAVLRRFPNSLMLLKQTARPTQRNRIVTLNNRVMHRLSLLYPGQRFPPIYNVGHHDSHAAAFFVSPFEDATILVMDGYGDDASTSVYTGAGNRVERQWHTGVFNSLGILYAVVTY
jgi:carbamoyltransferase